MFKYRGSTSLAIVFSAMNKMSTEKEAYCRENSLLCICFQQDLHSHIDLSLIECLIPGTVLGMIKKIGLLKFLPSSDFYWVDANNKNKHTI